MIRPAYVTSRFNGKNLSAPRVGMRGPVNRYGFSYGS